MSGYGIGFGGSSPVSDPFVFYPVENIIANGQRWSDARSRTPVADQGLVAGESTLVVIMDGQSLMASSVDSSYTVTQSRNHNFNVLDGAIYPMAEPVLGANYNPAASGALMADLGDRAISGGTCARFIGVPIAIGNTTWAQHADAASPPYFPASLISTKNRLAAKGLTATHVIIGLGENDNVLATSQASVAASIASVITHYRNAGITCPIIILRESMNGGATAANVVNAQAGATGTNVFVGFNMDTGVPNSGGNRYDGTHLASAGRALAAAGILADIVAHP
jgi:hypothetical protein